MARPKISQVEARELKRKLARLENQIDQQRNNWVQDWPSGTHLISRVVPNDERLIASIQTARLLGHAIVVTSVNPNELRFYALPLGK